MNPLPWKNESELVAEFTRYARHQQWEAYAETAGWDLLIVRKSDGFQIGIEAKMKLNTEVLIQTVRHQDGRFKKSGPDVCAVLVPALKAMNGLEYLANKLHIAVITARECNYTFQGWQGSHFTPVLPIVDPVWICAEWPENCPDCRHKLPEYVPDVTGGCSAPLKLTTWKIAAIKAAIVLERYGSISRDEIRALGMDTRRWTDDWLRSDGNKRWVPTSAIPDFKRQHPKNYVEISADFEKWNPVPETVLLKP